ncbi:MAG: hypothetical protein CVV24_13410 [Ignavibacteriae bacterium HGW-Ignavibacteriae-3]|nr:MAG: hypothetical protein CVV24_13410 [Ignavibacteriae bacterium HGW-Ignavibacteriae-3]
MQNSNGRMWIGVVLVIIGGLFLLDNFGFPWFYGFDVRHLVFSWHTIFIIVGLVLVVNHKDHFLGYIFLGIGAFGILRHFPFFSQFDFSDLWPIILLFVGLWLILRKNGNSQVKDKYNFNGENEPRPRTFSSEQSVDYIDETSIFNSINKMIRSDNFRGGKVTTIFGGTKLNLTESKLSPGENNLELTTIFGGAEIHVPPNWRVLLNVTSIFGGFEDKRYGKYNNEEFSEGILIIKGVTLFGGGEILY